MTDKDAFERVMELMGMKPIGEMEVEGGVLVEYEDAEINTEQFSTCGYDEFYAGAIFDENGKIVKAYIDSHVAYASDNCKEIDRMIED